MSSVKQSENSSSQCGVRTCIQGKERMGQAKQIMFPTDKEPEPDEEGTLTHTLYVRSHGAYLPGEQRRCVRHWSHSGRPEAAW
jgi:hypothetical protein